MINDYFKDMKTSIEVYEDRYITCPKKAALRMMLWNLRYLIMGEKEDAANEPAEMSTSEFKLEKFDKEISIAFFLAGGYGDYLLFANYLTYFQEKFTDESLQIYLCYHISSALTIFNRPLEHVTLVDVSKVKLTPKMFDLAFHFCVQPKLLYCDWRKIGTLSSSFTEYAKICTKYYKENKLIFDNHPSLDGMTSAKSIVKDIKRIQEPDFYGYLGIEEDYKYNLVIQEDEEAYLSSMALKDSPFILIHRGWDGTSPSNVKAWSENSCGDLIPRLKAAFPSYKLILFGTSRQQAPKNTNGLDLDLIDQTTLEQVKVLLKHAALLIDNEGGMVHLRHALSVGGGSLPSVVLFGPTSDRLFGYSENININAGACELFCEWLTSDWPIKCPRADTALCMEAITTDDVINACGKILTNACAREDDR